RVGGRSKNVVKAEETIIVEEPAPAPEPAPEPIPEPAPAPEPVKAAPAPMTQHIFFTLNSSKITRENQIKVDALVEYMKANPETSVNVTGYADKATGSSPYNMKLSMRRAQAVATALKAAGISESRITVDAKGDTEQPFAEIVKNRVAIAITH
ncbi:MAG: OmpA family protein, partial [Muribaculaceae bacterium]|nr:OmpA family protein [Muribaculaceae bacterium]